MRNHNAMLLTAVAVALAEGGDVPCQSREAGRVDPCPVMRVNENYRAPACGKPQRWAGARRRKAGHR